MMSPNKNKRGGTAVRETSPEPSPPDPRPCGSSFSASDVEETVPKRGGPNQYGPSSLRSLGFSGQKKPAELFRKDLISAMKLADKDSLPEESYFLISDPWRQEWEKGVQVPVNVTDIKQVKVKEVHEKSRSGDFRMPHKLLHEQVDEVYRKGQHELTGMPELADQLVRYDLDDMDVCWLEELNFRYREMGLNQINEWNMERVMEALENECHKNMMDLMKTEEGMGIEYDEDVVCDVCRSPESEETNEMVFCDKCDICIHQACYGITTIPQGSWLCRTCALGVKPTCMLCPNTGGAMKSTRSGTQWVHVSCALWIPEVGFGDPDRMEPVTKISHIPPSRWSLTCRLCKERVGACIQCSVKSCKTAFHVTCAFNEGLQMKTVWEQRGDSEDVKFKAFCPKHSKRQERSHSESEQDTPHKKGSPKDSSHKSPRKDGLSTPKKELTEEEKDNLRNKKLKSLEEEFCKMVSLSEISRSLQLEEEVVSVILVYWKLKRKCNWDKALLTPKMEEEDILEKQEEDSRMARRKMFVHLRHDLERARNLCYMISKREKMKRQLFHNKEHVFKNMGRVLKNKSLHLSKANINDIVQNYHFDSVYDDYGRSIQKLPGELSEEENESSEVDDNVSACSVSTEKTESMAGEAEKKTLSQRTPSEDRGSESTVKLGQSRRGRHKTRRKGPLAKKVKDLENQALASEASASSVRNKGLESEDDNVLIMSADESEDETVCRLPGTMAVKESKWKAGKGFLWSGSAVHSPTPRRVRQKKPRRGRKPWYEKQSQRYDLTPNLALSTDDDEDTKGSFSAGGKRDTSEESVLVDVIGEGDTGEQTGESGALRSEAGFGGTCSARRKTAVKREANKSRRKLVRMRRTKSESVQMMDTRTKLSDVASECDSAVNEIGSDHVVEGAKAESTDRTKEVRGKCVVFPFLPTRISNRKRRKPEIVLPDTDLTNNTLTDTLQRKPSDTGKVSERVKSEPSNEAERVSSLSPAKVRKSSRAQARMEKMMFEKDGASDASEEQTKETGKFPDLPDLNRQNRWLQPSNCQAVKSDMPPDTAQPAEVGGVGNSPHRPLDESRNLSDLPEKSMTPGTSEAEGGRESSLPGRKGRRSSYRAQLLWNKLLAGPGNSAANEHKPWKAPPGVSSQLPARQRRTSDSSQLPRSQDKSVNGVKIKQEKEAEEPLGNNGFQKVKHLEQKLSSICPVDLKTKTDSKRKSYFVSEDVNERVKNGFCRRNSRRGKRRLLANGVLDIKQRKIDTFFSKVSAEIQGSEKGGEKLASSSSVGCLPGEITFENRGSRQNSHSRKHCTEDSQEKYNGEQLPGNKRTVESPCLDKGGEGSRGGECLRKEEGHSGGSKELDTVSALAKGQCEADPFSMDALRALRSQSPSSDASTITGLHIDSRESTPRRFTRSQLADLAAEHCLPSQDAGGVNCKRTKLRRHRLKSAKASL